MHNKSLNDMATIQQRLLKRVLISQAISKPELTSEHPIWMQESTSGLQNKQSVG